METNRLDEKAIFDVARRIDSPDARGDYLRQICGDDHALLDRIAAMACIHDEPGSFLEPPPCGIAATLDMSSMAERPGAMVGRYKLLQEIGEGGMGVVYMAEQREPVRRKVALKIIKPGMDSRAVIGRFEAERQALALMDHPNIARVLDGGATESGRPFFVMELVHGVPITEYCDQHELATDQRLELFVSVCQAVQHAHQKGIIHRDLKPSNVLVTLLDGSPLVKVIDFGVAKATNHQLSEKTVFTGFGQMIGTPLYMSPEQAQMSAADVDTRSDIYSLGVLLYELLTGETPFDRERLREANYDEIRRVIREEEPPRPSTRISTLGQAATTISARRQTDPAKLSHALRGELDWIVMKALEKDRVRRYETATEFAKDIQRYLNDEPVEACPPSVVYRIGKFARRNRASALATMGIALALLLGAGIATGQAIRATKAEHAADERLTVATQQRILAKRLERLALEQKRLAEAAAVEERQQRDEADRQRDAALRNSYFSEMRQAQQDWLNGPVSRLHRALRHHLPESGRPDLRRWEWYYFLSICDSGVLTVRGDGLCAPSWSPDGKRLVIADGKGAANIWDLPSKKYVAALRGHTDRLTATEWSPDGRRIATSSQDGTVRIWDPGVGEPIKVLPGDRNPHKWFPLSWIHDGQRLLYHNEAGAFTIWNRATDESVRLQPNQGSLANADVANIAAWNPVNDRVAWGVHSKSLGIWEQDSGRELRKLSAERLQGSPAWSPDGQLLAAAVGVNTLLWDAATGQESVVRSGRDTFEVAWDPSSQRIATAHYGNIVIIWSTKPLAIAHTLVGHRGSVDEVAWSPDGRLLASGSRDETVKLWDPDTSREVKTLLGHTGRVRAIRWSPDSRHLVTTSDKEIKVWNVREKESILLADQGKPARTCALSPDARFAVTINDADTIRIWDCSTGHGLRSLPSSSDNPNASASSEHKNHIVGFSLDSQRVAWATSEGKVQVWDTLSEGRWKTLTGFAGAQPTCVAWDRTGQRVAAGAKGEVKVWNAVSGEELFSLAASSPPFSRGLLVLAWSNEHLATAGWDGFVRIWNAATGRLVWVLSGHVSDKWIGSLAWSQDGRFLASGGWDEVIRVWDAAVGKEVLSLRGHTALIASLAWHPDGQRLASSSGDGTVRIWDTAAGEEVVQLQSDGGESLEWSSDGERLVLASRSGQVKAWDASRGYRLAANPVELWAENRQPQLLESDGDSRLSTAYWGHAASELRAGNRGEASRWFQKAVEVVIAIPEKERKPADWINLGRALAGLGENEKARDAYLKTLEVEPDDALLCNNVAWMLATTADVSLRNPERAVELAKKACELLPENGTHWNTLGVAHYRADSLLEALAALQRSMEMPDGDTGYNWFFLAMAHWRLGHKDEARRWYDKAAAWMDEKQPQDRELLRFRDEASALLGIADGNAKVERKTKDAKPDAGQSSGAGGKDASEASQGNPHTPPPRAADAVHDH